MYKHDVCLGLCVFSLSEYSRK